MCSRILPAAILAILSLLLVAGIVLAAPPAVNWWTTSPGGPVQTSHHTLYGVLGQAVAGVSTQGTSTLCAGYLCGTHSPYHTYLPELSR